MNNVTKKALLKQERSIFSNMSTTDKKEAEFTPKRSSASKNTSNYTLSSVIMGLATIFVGASIVYSTAIVVLGTGDDVVPKVALLPQVVFVLVKLGQHLMKAR